MISGNQKNRRQVIRKPGYQGEPKFYFPNILIPWYPLPDNLIAFPRGQK
jgi:hypothetical protein